MGNIRPKVGSRVQFKFWEDAEYLGKLIDTVGNGEDRPATFEEWTGEVVSIEEPKKTPNGNKRYMNQKNIYYVKRDFDGFEQGVESRDILGYAPLK